MNQFAPILPELILTVGAHRADDGRRLRRAARLGVRQLGWRSPSLLAATVALVGAPSQRRAGCSAG